MPFSYLFVASRLATVLGYAVCGCVRTSLRLEYSLLHCVGGIPYMPVFVDADARGVMANLRLEDPAIWEEGEVN